MKKLIYLLLVLGFISCSEGEVSNNLDTENAKAQAVDPADCDDKIEDLGKKEKTEISLMAPADEGCTLE